MSKNYYKTVKILFLGMFGILNLSLSAQKASFDSLLKVNRYEIYLENETYTGNGLQFLSDEANKSQFFCICEEHNVLELNNLSSFLFEKFHKKHNYNYLVLEQGAIISSFYGLKKNRGNYEAITKLATSYPQSPTFATDEELKLIANVGRISTSQINPVWGVDQDLGALHILERLTELAPNNKAKDIVSNLADMARRYEMDRINGDTLFLSMKATPELFKDLPDLFHAESGSEASVLIDALQRTTRIYYNNYLGRKGYLTSYESGREREHSMRLRFMENYRKAQHAGDILPRVFVKMGHYHVLRGIYRLNVPTFGNFLSEFSISNGMRNFVLSSYVIESPEKWRNSNGLLQEVASDAPFTIIDLRPLRPYAHQNKINDLSESWKKLIFSADALLIIRGGKTGSYDIIKSALIE